MLNQILVKIQDLTSQNKKSLAVFDLDSTLFDVSPRVEKILLDFADVPLHRQRFPEQTRILKNIKTLRTDWGIQAALKRIGLDNPPIDFQQAIHDYWHRNFFSNHYLQFDSLYEGALEFVQAIDQAGAEIAYLTGRDVARMGTGSHEILRQWNFPLHEKAHLILKPHLSMDDAQFKTDYFIDVDNKGYEKIFFFENEPVNLHHLMQHCPHVEMIYFDSTHAGKAAPPQNLPTIVNFLFSKKDS